ncbi:MAG: hypothetical protein ACMXYK_05460 [Candidatus Woesearchaeota archaeon]
MSNTLCKQERKTIELSLEETLFVETNPNIPFLSPRIILKNPNMQSRIFEPAIGAYFTVGRNIFYNSPSHISRNQFKFLRVKDTIMGWNIGRNSFSYTHSKNSPRMFLDPVANISQNNAHYVWPDTTIDLHNGYKISFINSDTRFPEEW